MGESRVPVWQRLQDKNEIRYRVNPEHPLIVEFMDGLTDTMKRDFLGIVELAGAGLPVDSLFADIGSQPERVGGCAMSTNAHQHAVAATFNHLIRSGLSTRDVMDMLRVTEPFRSSDETESIIKTILRRCQQMIMAFRSEYGCGAACENR